MNWRGNIEFEVLMHEMTKRGHMLGKSLLQPADETIHSVDDIYRTIILTEVIDNQWLEEMTLRQQLTERLASLETWRSRLHEKTESLSKLAADEESLLGLRKKYTSEVNTQGQLMQKQKSKYEDVEHQLDTFSQGVSLVTNSDQSNIAALSERMRCVFNELRRVNANIEEKLVIAGVAKQRVMKDIRSIHVDLRSECSSNSSNKRNSVVVDFEEDSNLALHKIRDMKSVWRATLPSVPSVSGDPMHTDLVTALSISMGHFAEETVKDLAGTIAAAASGSGSSSGNNKVADTVNKEEESKLVGVISAETDRYRSISASLRFAIDDSKKFIADLVMAADVSTAVESHLNRILIEACSIVQNRLKCGPVIFWRKLDSQTAIGFTPALDNPLHAIRTDESYEFAFERSTNQTFRLKSEQQESLPADIVAMRSANMLPCSWELFGVSLKNFGMLIVRDTNNNNAFDPFSGIYCEQFFRRVLTAISPLQLLEVKQVSNQRPLDLIECLFELRCSGNNLEDIVGMGQRHMHKLFRCDNFALYIPIDQVNPETRLVKIAMGERQDPSLVLGYLKKLDNTVSCEEIASGLLSLEEGGPTDVIEAFKSGQDSLVSDTHRRHVRTITRGRTVTFVAAWTDMYLAASRPKEREQFYQPRSTSHQLILDTYLEMIQAVLTPILSQINSNFDKRDSLLSYHVIDEIERNTIRQLLKLS